MSRQKAEVQQPAIRNPQSAIGIALLGSTGSIGRQTLDVVSRLEGRFRIVALGAWRDRDALLAQAASLAEPPPLLALADEDAAASAPDDGPRILGGDVGLVELATHPDVDMVVVAT